MEPNMMPHVPQVAEELKELWAMTLPITAMNCVVYLRALISVLCLGRLGSLELAGGALSIGFTNITGYSVLVGLASALEPLCGQAHGCRNWELLVLSLHRAVALLLFAAVPISVLWLLMSPILLFLGQDPAITAVAATYCLYSLPDLLTNSLLQPLRVFLRSQGVAAPMFYCSALALALHLPLNLLLVFVLRLGVPGVAVAAVLTNLNMVLFMLAYLWLFCRRGKKGNTTVAGAGGGEDGGVVAPWYCWRGWGTVVKGVGPMMELAVPSCLGICLEWWWYEIMTVMAGLLPEPRVTVAAAAILIQTTSFMYTMPMALAACVSTRVGNELGAGKPARAKLAAIVALGCAFVMGAVNVTWTAVLRERWARFFTTDEAVVAVAAAVMPIMGLCELGNCPQTTGCGVLRGTARPAIGARINLACFYGVGTPVAVGLAFGLAVGFSGLWYGLLSAQVACAASVLFVVLVKTDWEVEAHRAHKLTQVEMGRVVVSNGRPMEGEEEEKKRFLGKDVENAL